MSSKESELGNGSQEGPLGDVSEAAGEDTSAEGAEEAAGRGGASPEVTSSLEGVVETLTELVSLQTPASVWLPNKRLSLQATGKVQLLLLPPACPMLRCTCSHAAASACWLGPFYQHEICTGMRTCCRHCKCACQGSMHKALFWHMAVSILGTSLARRVARLRSTSASARRG